MTRSAATDWWCDCRRPCVSDVILYIQATYNCFMDTESKTGRWSIRVSPSDDMIVRRVIARSRMSLNEYVVRNAVSAAIADLSDRRLFTLSAGEWEELQRILDRPTVSKPRLAELLAQPSVLETD